MAVVVLCVLIGLFYLEIQGLNALPLTGAKISTVINPVDVLVGLTIYLKTSIDFALLIGILMQKYPGLKNRYAIEIGTAVGNALGTAIVLAIWVLFKEVSILLGIMVLLASLVLFEMAHSSLEHVHEENTLRGFRLRFVNSLEKLLSPILYVISPVLNKIMPGMSMNSEVKSKSIWGLFITAFTVPFILGLDDFAGYVPLFQAVNVFGFGVGVFAGHCILNILLFINPEATIRIIKNPNIAILGSLAFIGLGTFGLYEAVKILFGLHH
jgi:hypothetical protein